MTNLMLFGQPNTANSTRPASAFSSKISQAIGWIAIVLLISASTAAMMLCPCDSVGIRDHYAISLVAVATLFAAAAAVLLFRRMPRRHEDSAILKALLTVAIVGIAVFTELFAAMEVVAWMARPR